MLPTLLTETEAIINSRPVYVETINNEQSLQIIPAGNLLTMRITVVIPPPGVLQRANVHSRHRWGRIHHLHKLMKLVKQMCNFQFQYIVLLQNSSVRNNCSVYKVINTNLGQQTHSLQCGITPWKQC